MQSADRQSRLLGRTRREAPAGEPSRNARLLERAGYVGKLMAGAYSLLPLGFRVLSNIEQILREEMRAIGGQEVRLPAIQPIEPWEQTGRDSMDVLYRLNSRDRRFVLGPSHEEVITPLVALHARSYRDLPLSVFQIQNKFRAEPRPKSGLLRGREFGMKDMYSFHTSEVELDEYYEQVKLAYEAVFKRCGIGEVTHYTFAAGGDFTRYSHEFQAVTEFGEDTIYLDRQSGTAINQEIIGERDPATVERLDAVKAIEVGNIFKLMRRFSDAMGMTVAGPDGRRSPVFMGCYGIGTTRLIGAIAEVTSDDHGLVWPVEVAPYRVHVVALPGGEAAGAAAELADHLAASGLSVLLDDRADSAGAKLADSDLLGIPDRIIVSSRGLAAGTVELVERSTAIPAHYDVADLDGIVGRLGRRQN